MQRLGNWLLYLCLSAVPWLALAGSPARQGSDAPSEVSGEIQIAWNGNEGHAFAFVLLLPVSLIRGESPSAVQQRSA